MYLLEFPTHNVRRMFMSDVLDLNLKGIFANVVARLRFRIQTRECGLFYEAMQFEIIVSSSLEEKHATTG